MTGSPILLGQYRPYDSFLHRLDARAKMITVSVVLVLALLSGSIWFYLFTLVSVFAALMFSGVPNATLVRNLRPIFFLVGITVGYHLLFGTDEGVELFSVSSWSLTDKALTNAAFFSLRLLLFVAIAFLVTLTSSPSEMADALAKLLRPLKRLKLPVDDLALIVFMAIRFIPVLYDEFMMIRHAQMIRGVDFSGSWMNRVRRMGSLLIPVFVGALSRADQLALAMEARGYGRFGERTLFSRASFGSGEYRFVALSIVGLLFLFWVTN
jgi:energy-coupling factor transport system permease protein